jgi:uncharacterized protein
MKQSASTTHIRECMIKKNQIVVYVVVLLMLSSVIAAVANVTGNRDMAILSVFTPSLLALVMVLLLDGGKGVEALFVDQLIKPIGWGWLMVALLVFPVVGIVAVGVHSFFGGLKCTENVGHKILCW